MPRRSRAPGSPVRPGGDRANADVPGPHDYPFNRGPGSIEMLDHIEVPSAEAALCQIDPDNEPIGSGSNWTSSHRIGSAASVAAHRMVVAQWRAHAPLDL